MQNQPNGGLTDAEKAVLHHTAEAWNAWVRLQETHPGINEEVCQAIHDIQFRVAYRVARRVDPSHWVPAPILESLPEPVKSSLDADKEKARLELMPKGGMWLDKVIRDVKHEMKLLREVLAMQGSPAAVQGRMYKLEKALKQVAMELDRPLSDTAIRIEINGTDVRLVSNEPWINQLSLIIND